MSYTHDADRGALGRRSVLLGLLGAAAVTALSEPAKAASGLAARTANLDQTAGSPTTATIASDPIPGYSYRVLTFHDFLPLEPSAIARTWNGNGAYSAGALFASVDIPAGALLRDVEWYVQNTSGSNASFYCALWTPSSGYVTLFGSTSVPPSSGLTATRTVLPTSVYGPYPSGSKISMYAGSTSSTVLLNGVRLGFINGGLEYAIRPVPDTFYDTLAAGGKFANNETRTITVSGVDPGTTGVVLRVTAFSSASPGTIKIYPANQVAPGDDALSILASQNSVGEVTVMLPSNRSRQIKVAVTRGVHLRLAVVATLR